MEKVIFDGYSVTDDGRVLSTKSGRKRELKYRDFGRNGRYKQVRLWVRDIKKQRSFYVHRLVAEAFLPNPDNLPQVNHIDGDSKNNHVSNLEWCTGSQNIKHAYDTGLYKKYVCEKCGRNLFGISGEGKVCGNCRLKENSRSYFREKRKAEANAIEYAEVESERDMDILSAYKRGEKQTVIARKHGLSRQRIHQIINYYKIGV